MLKNCNKDDPHLTLCSHYKQISLKVVNYHVTNRCILLTENSLHVEYEGENLLYKV
jgi:hypothetical protein